MRSLREWFQIHTPVHLPSLNISKCFKWILISREFWTTVHHCAKTEENFDDLCCESSQPIVEYHKIRTQLKRRWIFKRASGNRCLRGAGKTWPPRKAAAAAAAAAAIPCQYIREQSRITEKEKRFPKNKIRTMIPGWHTLRRHYSRFSASSMSTSTPWWMSQWRSESKINWKENSRVRISRIVFTAEASNL